MLGEGVRNAIPILLLGRAGKSCQTVGCATARPSRLGGLSPKGSAPGDGGGWGGTVGRGKSGRAGPCG